MSAHLFVGKAGRRPEGADKATGRTLYIHDITRPGMLWGKIKWSEYAHARIKRIDTSRAKKLQGVRAVLTGYDIPDMRMGFLKDNFPLKRCKVRQFRDEVAAVAAVDPETAAEAVELIEVEYEPLPGVFDPREAMEPGAPLVHETWPDGRPREDNLLPVGFPHFTGDLDGAKKASAHIVEGRYSTPLIQQSCMGTAGCIAEFDTDGNLTIWAKTQIPFLAQRDFTRALGDMGLEGRNVRVVVPALGGGFGTGLDTHCYEFISILLSWATGKPVKILYDREEEFAFLSPRQSAEMWIRQGCDASGRLTFREFEVVQDNGAYGSWGATYPSVMLLPVTSLYRVPVVRFHAKLIYTNNTYCQAMRGYGNPEATWAIESSLDELAEAAGRDPVEIRRINCNEAGEITPMEARIRTCGLRECLDRAAQRIGWKEKRGVRTRGRDGGLRGVGLASLIHVGGSGRIYRSDASGIILKLDDFGNVNVYHGGVEMGQGLHAVIRQGVAEALGVLPGQVHINQTDTGTCPWDVGTHASRGAFMALNAALMAAEKLRARLFQWAERIWPGEARRNLERHRKEHPGPEAPIPDLEALGRKAGFELREARLFPRVEDPEPWMVVDFARFLRAVHFRARGTMFTEEAFYDPPSELPDWKTGKGNLSATYTYGTQSVEVEVDRETGEVRILEMASALDVGKVLNPVTLRGQVLGGIAQGVGYALYEEVKTSEGRILNPGFTDYKLPTANEMGFPIHLDFVETEDETGPFGAKGVGEPGLVPTAPAIANAVYDAVGVRIRDLPVTPEKVLAALKEREGS